MRYSHFHKTSGANAGTGSDSIMATLMVTAATCDQKQQIQRHVPPLKEGNPIQTEITLKLIFISSSTPISAVIIYLCLQNQTPPISS